MNRRLPTIIATWMVLLFQPLFAIGQTTQATPAWDQFGPWHMMWVGGWGFWWIFPLFMFLMMLLGVVFMMRGPWGHGHHPGRDATTSALEILNERFAKGEIAKEDYEEKKAAIVRRV